MKEELFRPIEGFPGYRVSRVGEVQSCWSRGFRRTPTDTWRPLKPYRRRRGCLTVNLHRDGRKSSRYVHHLVLEAFVGPRGPGLICCHGDGDPANNRIENLRWDTYQSNSDDMLRHGTRLMGSAARSKLDEGEVAAIRRSRSEGVPFAVLASMFGVTRQNVQAIVHRRSWRHLP